MPHPLVDQLRFTRGEFQRALVGVTDEEARRRIMPMNCMSWIVGHLASQEQRYWLVFAQGKDMVAPELKELGFGKPASTPPLDAMWEAWHTVMGAVDPYLDTLTTADMLTFAHRADGTPLDESLGTMIRRTTYHYWYHLGEGLAVRQLLGHDYAALRLRYWCHDGRSAWVLDEIGKELPITVGIIVENNVIRNLRVLTYRESRGGEVVTPAFTDQFTGAALEPDHRLGVPIDGISGATLSVQALTRLATMALFLHTESGCGDGA